MQIDLINKQILDKIDYWTLSYPDIDHGIIIISPITYNTTQENYISV